MYSDDEADMDDYSQSKENKSDNKNILKKELVEQVSLLGDICLNSIFNNFPRFSAAFNVTDDPDLRKNLQFLQRVYTGPLLERAIENGYFERSSFCFLINKYSKELDMSIFKPVDYDKVIERILEIGHVFVKVDLSSTLLNQLVVNRILSLIPNVNILHIYHFCSEETMKIISSSCKKLEELYLDKCFSNELKETGLFSFSSLKLPSLTGSRVRESTLSNLLDSLLNLKILRHHKLPIVLYQKHRDDLLNNTLTHAKKYKLVALDFTTLFDFCLLPQTEILIICIAVCPNLKTLTLEIKDRNSLDLISQLSDLENVTLKYISWNALNVMNLDNFLICSGAKLKRLKASWFEISINTLTEKCPILEYISLCSVSFVTELPVNSNCLNCLHELSLESLIFHTLSTVTAVHSLLNSSPNIIKLVISRSEFKNSDINSILSNFCTNSNSLQSVTFVSCDIEGVLLESILLGCATLKCLIIESCEAIGSNVIKSLRQISQSKQNIVEIVWHKDECYYRE